MGITYGYSNDPFAQSTNAYNEAMQGYGNQQAAYQQGTAGILGGFNSMITRQQGIGDAQRTSLNQQYDRQGAQQQQSMVSRGMGNSTVLDSAERGVNYDRANSQIGLQDSLNQRVNDINTNKLNYQASAQQGLAGLQGQQIGFQDQAQQNYQQQAVQWAMAREQQKSQALLQSQSLNNQYQNQFNQHQYNLQAMDHQAGIQDAYQSKYGYYAHGGMVKGPPGRDAVPARLTRGEFVLSHPMIQAIHSGQMSLAQLSAMIKQQAGLGGNHGRYEDGGTVAKEGPGYMPGPWSSSPQPAFSPGVSSAPIASAPIASAPQEVAAVGATGTFAGMPMGAAYSNPYALPNAIAAPGTMGYGQDSVGNRYGY